MLEVTDGESIAAAVKTVEQFLEDTPLVGLVNNAGIGVSGPLEFVNLDRLRWQLEVNVVGPVAVTQAFLPLLRAGRGRIVNIGSVAGKVALAFFGPYAASKHALEAITDALRRELSPWNMHVAIVEPGSIKTPIWDKAQKNAAELLESLSPRAEELYGKTLRKALTMAGLTAERGAHPDAVAKVVHHALSASRPKLRYLVGIDARLARTVQSLFGENVLDLAVKAAERFS